MFYNFFTIIFIICLSHANLHIDGAKQEIHTNIENRLKYKLNLNHPPLHIKDFIQREIKAATKPYGYFNPTIRVELPDDNLSAIDIHLSLNQVSHIDSIHIDIEEHNQDINLKKDLYAITTKYQYSPFSLDSLDKISADIKNTMVAHGYYYASLERTHSHINVITEKGSVSYFVDPHEKNIFGSLVLNQDQHPAACFNRYMTFKTGQPFNQDKLKAFQQNLVKSGQYASINMKTSQRDQDPSILDVHLDYTKNEQIKYLLGVGGIYEPESQTIQPKVELNLSINDIGFCGPSLHNVLQISTSEATISNHIHIPSMSNLHDFIQISNHIETNYLSEDDQRLNFNILAQKEIYSWFIQPSVNFLIERSTHNAETSNAQQTFSLLYPKLRIFRYFTQHNGYIYLKGTVLGNTPLFLSHLNFYQHTFTIAHRHTFQGITLSNQLFFGEIYTNQFDQYPTSMKYTLGGPKSNRGLKPSAYNHGKSFFLSRNSGQVKLSHSLLIGPFFDTGYCASEEEQETLHPSAGILLSYESAYGILNLSIGKPLNGDNWVLLLHGEPKMG